MMKVRYQGGEDLATEYVGTLVQCVHIPKSNPQTALGKMSSNDEPLPNVWAVILDDRTKTFLCLPIYRVKGALMGDGR